MERSEQINEIAKALSAAQAELEGAKKEAVNPHLKSKYADLASVWDACRNVLPKNGLSVAQMAEPAPDGFLSLTTMLMHSSGQFLAGTIMLPLDKPTAQSYGAAMTYARRYGLSAIVGVSPEDDDGHEASQGQGNRYNNRPESRGDQRVQQALRSNERSSSFAHDTGARQDNPAPQEPEELELRPETTDRLKLDDLRHQIQQLIPVCETAGIDEPMVAFAKKWQSDRGLTVEKAEQILRKLNAELEARKAAA